MAKKKPSVEVLLHLRHVKIVPKIVAEGQALQRKRPCSLRQCMWLHDVKCNAIVSASAVYSASSA